MDATIDDFARCALLAREAGYDGVEIMGSEGDSLRHDGIEPHIIGGAFVAVELDAKRAIKQGTELAARL